MTANFRLVLVLGLAALATTMIASTAARAQVVTIDEFPIPTPGSQPLVIAPGPDGNLFFTESGTDKIGRITTSGVVIDVPSRGILTGLDSIVAGPDGNLWYTESATAGGHISKVNPALSSFTHAGPPPPCSPEARPHGIVVGPDGNLWVALLQCNAILKFPTLGPAAGNTYVLPNANSGPLRITAGPDGALWFTQATANKIGRITTAGVITEFPIPTANAGLRGIAAGADGALWFTESAANKIGRITAAGVVTEYPIPTSGSGPREIAAGPDGALWFTEFDGNKIGRITTGGIITEFPVPTAGSGPSGIAMGADGALWFTEFNASKIGRLRITSPIARHDFNGDRRSDILWRNTSTGENYLYPMSGTAILGSEGYVRTVADQSWQVAGIGDFDGDGKADILWRNNATGENYVYFMDGATIKPGEGYLRTVADQNWRVAGTGDFDGDGKDDILWRNSVTGENYLYPMNELAIKASEGYLRSVADLAWRVAGVGDFDGDGKADVLWRNSSSGQNYLYFMDGTTIKPGEGYLRTVPELNWQVVGIGDHNGDGKADVLWRNASTGENYLYPMDGLAILGTEGYLRTVADLNWQVKGTGDYDSDGKADVLWRHATTGENYLYPMNGTVIKATEGYLRSVPPPDWQIQNPPLPVPQGPVCTPTADVPDDSFLDTNCDGFDGTIADGIFVSPDGSDANPGTMALPVQSIGTGIARAVGEGKQFVYVSAGNYSETVTIDVTTQGIGLHGGYLRSSGWARDGTRAVITGPRTGALRINNVTAATIVEYLEFRSANATVAGTSSHAIVVTNSTGLRPRFLTARAGAGANGVQGASAGTNGDDGGDGVPGTGGYEDDTYWYCAGNQPDPATTYPGGDSCTGATSSTRGGDGRRGCITNGANCAGVTGNPGSPNPAGTFSDGGAGVSGGYGNPGQPGQPGGAGIDGSSGSGGVISSNEWVPDSGNNGGRGVDGSGGGGGAGGGSSHSTGTCNDWGGSGGGGGGGGCGATGGSGGSGGGASIAVLLVNSGVTAQNVTVTTGNGGNGGAGRTGGTGGPGGAGGNGGNGHDEGKSGGSGGDGAGGGRGGHGGGGAGGWVVGVYRSSSTWSDSGTTIPSVGAPGLGGASSGNPGMSGSSHAIY